MTREERAYNYASKKKLSKFTVGEIAKHYDDGYSDGKEEAINKACEWLEEHLLDYWQQSVTDSTNFINDFHKAMEDKDEKD